MQEQLNLLKEQVNSLELAVNNSDINLFNQNLNDIKNNITNIEKQGNTIKQSSNLSNAVIEDKNLLKQKAIKVRIISKLKSIRRLSLTNLKLLKGKLSLLKTGVQVTRLKAENKVLEKAIEVIKKRYVLENKEKLRGQNINQKKHQKNGTIKHVAKSNLNLFKQRLLISANTVRFKNIAQKVQIGSLKAQNKALENLNNVKDKGHKARINFINKKNILKKKINTRLINTKNKIRRVTVNQVDAIKNKVKDIYYNVTTTIGVKAIDAYESVKDKFDYAKTAVAVTALDTKDKIIDKSLLMNDKIKRKFSSAKNIITRKTGMQIALFKQDIKKKLNMSPEQYNANQEMINKLKQQRSALVDQFLSSPMEPHKVR